MALNHSEETHQHLIERIPKVTGRDLHSWWQELEAAPWQTRFEDRVNWLRDEHGLAQGHASAIVHEFDKRRAARDTR
jgi:hypothetical protein